MIARVRAKLAYEQRKRANARALAAIGTKGPGCTVQATCTITSPQRVELGSNVWIGDGAFIRAEGGLRIGDNTHISRNMVLYTANHEYEGQCLPYDNTHRLEPVDIGRNVWIGMNVCIAPGTTIGEGAIIAMGAVVFGEVPPFAIVGNQPWRIVGHRDEEHYRRLDDAGAYGGSGGRPLPR